MEELDEKDASGDGAAKKKAVIILHGLLGQGRGWRQLALSPEVGSGGVGKNRDVMLVDLRNHGESDHHQSMKYTEMADDLVRFIDSRELETVTIIGHNMGAKTAMACAQMHPDRVSGFISLDTGPMSSPL